MASATKPMRTVIDTHHHFFPPAYVAGRRKEILAMGPLFPQILEWTPEQSLRAMDDAGVAKAILSITAPGVWFGDDEDAGRMARTCNEYGAELVKRHSGRFGLFAALPMPNVERTLAEIAHAFDRLPIDGVGMLTNHVGRYLGDPAFDPIMAELDRRHAIVYVHPTTAHCCANAQSELPPAVIEFPFETTRTISSLLYSDTFLKFPNLRFIFSHGGGAVPMLISRIEGFAKLKPTFPKRYPAGFSGALSRHYFDTVSITEPSAIAAVKSYLAPEQLLFGTDFPYGAIKPQIEAIKSFSFSDTEHEAVLGGNARRLLELRPISAG